MTITRAAHLERKDQTVTTSHIQACWVVGLSVAAAALSSTAGPGVGLAAPAAHATYKGAPVLGPIGPPQPSPTAPASFPATNAGWSCQSGKCSYVKLSGAWSDCFVAWSPTFRGWMPTRYCR